MSINNNNIRILITISKETKEKLEQLAKEEHRSVSNFVNTLILQKIATQTNIK